MKLEHATRAKDIEVALSNGKLGIVVYGDDHVIYTHVSLFDIINEKGFAKFLLQYFNIEIRELRNNIPFFSVRDGKGELKEAGVVFLQRYFIENNANEFPGLPYVLPYRPMHKTVLRYAYGATAGKYTIQDWYISLIGMAYDSMGTNSHAYEFCEFMIKELTKDYSFNINDILTADVHFITTMLKKSGLHLEELKKGFPTLEELLSRNKMDNTKNGHQLINDEVIQLAEDMGFILLDESMRGGDHDIEVAKRR